MQERCNSFDVLKNELLEKLETRGCSSFTILRDYISKHGNNQYYTNLRTVVYRLNDLVEGKWEDVHSDKGKQFILSDEFADILNKYCSGKVETFWKLLSADQYSRICQETNS